MSMAFLPISGLRKPFGVELQQHAQKLAATRSPRERKGTDGLHTSTVRG